MSIIFCIFIFFFFFRKVIPSVEPGFLKDLIQAEAPLKSSSWQSVMEDIENKIMPGLTHWQHPKFCGFFTTGTSTPAIISEMFLNAINVVGVSWVCLVCN